MDKFSVPSSSQKSAASLQDDVEESGWTSYIEYFYNNNNNGEDDSGSEFTVSPSLISDAATGISEKGNRIAGPENIPRKLRPKPKKKFCDDDSLEDTASSPVNSPKVSHMKQIEMNPRKNKGCTVNSSFVMGKDLENDRTENANDKRGTKLDGKNELRSRGLCLVPVSAFDDYNSS